MNKKIISLIITFLLVIPMLPLNFVKADNYSMELADLKLYKASQRIVKVEEGTLTAELTLKNTGDPLTPFIAVMLCKGTESYYQTTELVVIESAAFSSGEEKTLSAQLVCDDSEDVFLKTMIFDNKTDLNLISGQVAYPTEKDLTLTSIKINGTVIDGFNPNNTEYEVVIPFGAGFPTLFEYTLYNESVTAVKTEPTQFGEALTIKLTVDGYGEKTYTVTVNEAPDPKIPRISDLKYNGGEGTTISPVEEGILRFSDKADSFSDFKNIEFGENSYYILPKYSDYTDDTYKDASKEWISFKINRSADIYIVTAVNVSNNYLPWLNTQEYKVVGLDGQLISPLSDYSLKMAVDIDTTANPNGRKISYLYKKTYVLPTDGNTLEHITLNGDGLGDSNYGTYGVIVDFIDETTLLTDIKVDGITIPGFDKDITEYEIYNVSPDAVITYDKADAEAVVTTETDGNKIILKVSKDANEKVYTLTKKEKACDLQVLETLSSSYSVVDSFDTSTKRYEDKDYVFSDLDGFDEVIENNQVKYIQTAFSDNIDITASYTQSDVYLKFRINASANVYVLTPYQKTDNGYQTTLDGWEPVEKQDGTPFELTTNSSNANFTRRRAYLYKKTVQSDGAYDYKTVTINCPTDSSYTTNQYVYTVLVEFLPGTPVANNSATTFALEAKADEQLVTSASAKTESGDLIISGTSSVLNSLLTLVVQNNGTLDAIDFEKAIYINSIMTDAEGKFSVKIPLYDKRGKIQYFVKDKKGEIDYNPTGNNSLSSFSIGNNSSVISGNSISISVPSGTDVRGLVSAFSVHKDAKVMVGDTVQQSGVTKNDFTNPVTYKVIADDGTEKTYIVTVNVESGSGGGFVSGGGGGGAGGNVSSSVPGSEVTVTEDETQKSEIIPQNTFSDLTKAHWAYESVEFLHSEGIIDGYEDGRFMPESFVTREQAVKILVNAFHLVPKDKAVIFDDVSPDEWYTFYIEIAVQNELVNGISDNLFGIGKPITRQDMATILSRLILRKGLTFTTSETEDFKDKYEASTYAVEAIDEINSYGLIKGYPDKTIRPLGRITRAEFCALIQRILNK